MSDGPETVHATGYPGGDHLVAGHATRMRHADVNGIRLAYDISGSGPPLVLIMGYRLSSRAWPLDFVATLAERFTVIVLDNRGTGESDKPTIGYEIANMSRDVCGLLDHLQIAHASILGYSMGGAIAQELVRQFPDRVLALVLCATMCGGPRATYASASVVRVMREHEGLTPEQIARRIWTITYSPAYLERHRELAEDQMRREIAAPTPLHAADLQFQAFAEFDCSRALPGFRVPTLVLTGDQDRLVAPQNSKFIASLIPGARLVVIPDCGHRLMWEATDECVEMVAEFLSGIPEGRRDITAAADAQANQPDVMGDFFDLFTPVVDVFTTWPLMLAGVGADTMTVARQAVYFGGRAQFGDGKPIILVAQFGSNFEFASLSNWLKVLGYRPVMVDLSDGKSVADLVQNVTERLGRKAVLVATASGVRAASAVVTAHKHLISDIVVLNASNHPDLPAGVRAHFITAGWSLAFAMAALPQALRKIQIQLIEVAGSVAPETINRSAPRLPIRRTLTMANSPNSDSKMNRVIYVLNGPNLNLLGKRQPHIYGHETLADVEADCRKVAADHDLEIHFYQSNREYEIIDWIHKAREAASGIVINPAAFTHTSVAILDALNAFDGIVIEVHISNVHKREEFRHHSFVSKRADGVIAGLGTQGYTLALRRLAHLLDKADAK